MKRPHGTNGQLRETSPGVWVLTTVARDGRYEGLRLDTRYRPGVNPASIWVEQKADEQRGNHSTCLASTPHKFFNRLSVRGIYVPSKLMADWKGWNKGVGSLSILQTQDKSETSTTEKETPTMTTSTKSELLTTKEAAEMFGYGVTTLTNFSREFPKTFPHPVKNDLGRNMYDGDALDAWMTLYKNKALDEKRVPMSSAGVHEESAPRNAARLKDSHSMRKMAKPKKPIVVGYAMPTDHAEEYVDTAGAMKILGLKWQATFYLWKKYTTFPPSFRFKGDGTNYYLVSDVKGWVKKYVEGGTNEEAQETTKGSDRARDREERHSCFTFTPRDEIVKIVPGPGRPQGSKLITADEAVLICNMFEKFILTTAHDATSLDDLVDIADAVSLVKRLREDS